MEVSEWLINESVAAPAETSYQWLVLVVVQAGGIAQWRWENSYLLHTAEARPPGQKLPLNMNKKREKN